MKIKNASVKLSQIIEDFDIYPRHSIDGQHVRRLQDAVESGNELPPPILEAGSFRIVDGFHRVRVYRRVMDAAAEIPATLVEYESDAELFAHAITLNADHGKGLSKWDALRCIELSKEKGLSWGQLAQSLRISGERLQELERSRTGFDVAGKVVPLKRASKHLAGKTLTERQEDAQRRLGGNEARHYFRQILVLINGEVLPTDDPVLIGLAEEVVSALSDWLGSVVRPDETQSEVETGDA